MSEANSRSRVGRLLKSQTAIDFYGRRMVGFIAGVVIVVITVVSLVTQGLNLGLDFEGGNAWDVPASESFDIDEAEQVLADNGIDTAEARIQRRSSEATDVITIEIEEVPNETAAAITADFATAAGVEVGDISVAFTSSTWGQEITEKAIRALVVFFIAVSLFISVRFEFNVTPATVVAFLTILGYSLYDTIVVFDRVKENQAKFSGSRTPYSDIVNISMNQVLMRSLNTSIASILPVLSLLAIGWGLLGAEALEEFALALFIGMVSGVYSSIFVATPLLASMRRDSDTRVRRPRLTGEALRAAVVGSSASGRNASHVYVGLDGDTVGDDDELAVTSGAPVVPRTQPGATPDQLLSHPPRPRKKKRH